MEKEKEYTWCNVPSRKFKKYKEEQAAKKETNKGKKAKKANNVNVSHANSSCVTSLNFAQVKSFIFRTLFAPLSSYSWMLHSSTSAQMSPFNEYCIPLSLKDATVTVANNTTVPVNKIRKVQVDLIVSDYMKVLGIFKDILLGSNPGDTFLSESKLKLNNFSIVLKKHKCRLLNDGK